MLRDRTQMHCNLTPELIRKWGRDSEDNELPVTTAHLLNFFVLGLMLPLQVLCLSAIVACDHRLPIDSIHSVLTPCVCY